MLKTNTLLFLIAASILAVVHYISLELYLYWRYLWLDIPVHFLGGAVAALGAYAFFDLRLPLAKHIVGEWWRTMLFVVLIMIAWELFELWSGMPIQDSYARDTASDLVNGFIGGLFGYFIAKRMRTL